MFFQRRFLIFVKIGEYIVVMKGVFSLQKHIPNAFTFGNLLCGFLALVFVFHGDTKNAAILILIGMMLDSLDGRLARIFNVAGNFGKELDSLADLVTFGVAPAFIGYSLYFEEHGIIGIAIVSLFPLFGAYRLARFNVTDTSASLVHFQGVPITAAGGIIAFLSFFHKHIPFAVFTIVFLLFCYLMVSTIKIPSFKKVSLPRYGILITIFIILMSYKILQMKFDKVPVLFYVALALYFLFMGVRTVQKKGYMKPKQKKKQSKQYHHKKRK